MYVNNQFHFGKNYYNAIDIPCMHTDIADKSNSKKPCSHVAMQCTCLKMPGIHGQ